MIVSLAGTLGARGADWVVVEVQGVGYQVFVSARQLAQLPGTGTSVRLATHLVHREDAMLLFGFPSEAERELFLHLTSVGGVGARTAMGILSALTPEEVVWAIAEPSPERLAKAPGVGKKTAERIILELREKLGERRKGAVRPVTTPSGRAGFQEHEEVELALLSLGFAPPEIRQTLAALPADLPSEEAIRRAIAALSV